MGIIDSLSAGFRFAAQRIHLLLLPLVLDLLLWLAPRLSVAPLYTRFADLYAGLGATAGMPGDMAEMTAQLADILDEVGQSSNLMEMLVSQALFHVPSLLVGFPALQQDSATVEIASLGSALGYALVLGLLGLLLGAFYMNFLARTLPLGEGDKSPTAEELARRVLRHWVLSMVFIVGVTIVLLLLYVPATVGITLMSLLSPVLASGAVFLLSGVTVGLFFYLYFVIAGVVLDNVSLKVAVWRSITLVRHNFWPTLGFILVTTLISSGISLLLHRVAVIGMPGAMLAILGNAYVGTGMALALLIFYRTRLLQMAERLHQSA